LGFFFLLTAFGQALQANSDFHVNENGMAGAKVHSGMR